MKQLALALLAAAVLWAPRVRADGAPDLSFDFELPGDGKRPAAAPAQQAEQARRILDIDRQVKRRRAMLVTHQALGFATLAALAATVVIGHLNYADKFTSGDFSNRYARPHLGLGISVTSLFAATGGMALFAPNPYPKPVRLDTALVHKVAMAAATAGMVAQIVLGPIAAARDGRNDQGALGLGHVVVGYATFAFMATGVVTYFF